MGEAVGCCGEDVGDGGVNVLVVTGVTAQLSAHGVVAHNVRQVVPEHEHLRQTEGFYFQGIIIAAALEMVSAFLATCV